MRKLILTMAAIAAVATGASAQVTVTVDANNNSTTGGTPLVTTFNVVAGQVYGVTQNPLDLWASGGLPRWSDGNGIVARLAQAGDDSGYAPGTQIGTNSFGPYTQGNLTANYGSLVAVLGGNQFQFLGGNRQFTATQTGLLSLGYFDSNNGDNVGEINFNIAAIPEPAAWTLMIIGFGAAGVAMRRRRGAAGTPRTA